jgi:hypothetical protein
MCEVSACCTAAPNASEQLLFQWMVKINNPKRTVAMNVRMNDDAQRQQQQRASTTTRPSICAQKAIKESNSEAVGRR